MNSTMTGVSSYALTAAPRLAVIQAQAALSTAQVELSSGKLADIGLGLGSATGTYLSLGVQASRLQSMKDSNGTTATTLAAATAGLDALRTTASTFLASLTEAASSGNTGGVLATTASANLGALTSTLNTTVGGVAVFGGIASDRAPMTDYAPGTPAQSAVAQSYAASFGNRDPATISGPEMQAYLRDKFSGLFSASNYGSTWSKASGTAATAQISGTETVATSVSANAEPFRDLAQAYTMMKEYGGAGVSGDAGQQVIQAATQLVSAALAGLTTAEAGVGQAQSAVSDANDRMTKQIAYLSARSTDLVGVDPSALSTEISGLQTKVRASYEITSQLQQLSLVNYLK